MRAATQPKNSIKVVHWHKNFSFCRLLVTLLLRFHSFPAALNSLSPLVPNERVFATLAFVKCNAESRHGAAEEEPRCKMRYQKAGRAQNETHPKTLKYKKIKNRLKSVENYLRRWMNRLLENPLLIQDAKEQKNGILDLIYVCLFSFCRGLDGNQIFYSSCQVGQKLQTIPRHFPSMDFPLMSKHLFAYLTLMTDRLFLNGLIFL